MRNKKRQWIEEDVAVATDHLQRLWLEDHYSRRNLTIGICYYCMNKLGADWLTQRNIKNTEFVEIRLLCKGCAEKA